MIVAHHAGAHARDVSDKRGRSSYSPIRSVRNAQNEDQFSSFMCERDRSSKEGRRGRKPNLRDRILRGDLTRLANFSGKHVELEGLKLVDVGGDVAFGSAERETDDASSAEVEEGSHLGVALMTRREGRKCSSDTSNRVGGEQREDGREKGLTDLIKIPRDPLPDKFDLLRMQLNERRPDQPFVLEPRPERLPLPTQPTPILVRPSTHNRSCP
jgi:hypothetical protein